MSGFPDRKWTRADLFAQNVMLNRHCHGGGLRSWRRNVDAKVGFRGCFGRGGAKCGYARFVYK